VTGSFDGTRFRLAPDYDISRLIVGGWQLSAGHRPDAVARDEAVERLVAMADMGLDTFDCADIYTGVEELYGAFLKRWRTTSGGARPIRIHTKLVPDLGALEQADGAYVRSIVERSLTRLGVDRLDLVQFYWWDFQRGSWLEAVGTLADLQSEGKIRLVGATNFTADDVARMEQAGVRVAANQVQYSALDRRPETGGLAAACAASDMRMLCFGGLAGGFLTSTWLGRPDPGYDGLSNRSLTKYRLIIDEFGGWQAYQALLQTLSEIGEERGTDAAAVALRFVLDQPGVAAAIVGFSSVARMQQNLRALDLELTREDHARVRAHADAAPGPGGDIFGLERDKEGPHGRIMKYELNAGDKS
jgi:aryl-alcohol dehydrogenase-like predicted oxidoreductase